MNDNKMLLGKCVDDDFYTLHVLRGKTFILLAEFSANQKSAVIENIKNDYPVIAEKLKNIDLLKLGVAVMDNSKELNND